MHVQRSCGSPAATTSRLLPPAIRDGRIFSRRPTLKRPLADSIMSSSLASTEVLYRKDGAAPQAQVRTGASTQRDCEATNGMSCGGSWSTARTAGLSTVRWTILRISLCDSGLIMAVLC